MRSTREYCPENALSHRIHHIVIAGMCAMLYITALNAWPPTSLSLSLCSVCPKTVNVFVLLQSWLDKLYFARWIWGVQGQQWCATASSFLSSVGWFSMCCISLCQTTHSMDFQKNSLANNSVVFQKYSLATEAHCCALPLLAHCHVSRSCKHYATE